MAAGRKPKAGKKGGRKKTEHTPVMQQYLRSKADYPRAILFFRLGDFYEMFYEDAVLVHELIGLTLTARGKGPDGEKIPMAGVPHHAAAGYISKLLKLGRSVALAEQMADPKTVKGVVPREVVQVITPGLCLDEVGLSPDASNYVVALVEQSGVFGLAALDISVSELRGCEVASAPEALAELARLSPRELLVAPSSSGLAETFKSLRPGLVLTPVEEPEPEESAELSAAAVVRSYAKENLPHTELPALSLARYSPSAYLVLDEAAIRNLELVTTLRGEKDGALLAFIDRTKTAMGARLLRRRLLAPLADVAAIRRRLDDVERFVRDVPAREELRAAFGSVPDLSRLATRVSVRLVSPRDLAQLRRGLATLASLQKTLAAMPADLADPREDLRDTGADVHALLAARLADELPAAIGAEPVIREGVDKELDEQRALSRGSRDVIAALETREREATGIPSLRVKFNKVFGYFIEVTRTHLKRVPERYVRKQTIANGERYVTEELAELQEAIAEADQLALTRERLLYAELVEELVGHGHRLAQIATEVAALDVSVGLAVLAHAENYVRPTIDDGERLEIRAGRHPLVERICEAGMFVPNDVVLDANDERMMVITGPNMSGKSTVMRQVALIAILAQSGSFVPAEAAHIGLVDRVFTRVGASDNLSQGQSTFMVEMQEAATILREASHRSLVVLDEIGRGTSTYDGVAIAWAVAEHLHDVTRARAMFATHYHELCELAEVRPGVANYNVAAVEQGDSIVFLHTLQPGGANRSYGVAVAELAGVPPVVLARAKAILADLERGAPLPSGGASRVRPVDADGRAQLSLFAPAEVSPSVVEETLRELDVDRLTPLDALVALAKLKAMLPNDDD